MLTPNAELLQSLRRAFHKYGFAKVTMGDIARECGFTRRSLYNYFSSKEEAFRAAVRAENAGAIERGLDAGRAVREEKGSAVDIMAAIMDTRFGATRRHVETSPHTVELNAIAFMLCRDIIIEVAIVFQRELAMLIASLVADGYLLLDQDLTPEEIAQTLANGARGVNQAIPPADLADLSKRYHHMCRAVLFGCAVETAAPGLAVSRKGGIPPSNSGTS